jgi:hypothetical protein
MKVKREWIESDVRTILYDFEGIFENRREELADRITNYIMSLED